MEPTSRRGGADLVLVARGLVTLAGGRAQRLLHRGPVATHIDVHVQRDGGGQPGGHGPGRDHASGSLSSAARSAAIRTLGELGRTIDSSAGTSWIRPTTPWGSGSSWAHHRAP